MVSAPLTRRKHSPRRDAMSGARVSAPRLSSFIFSHLTASLSSPSCLFGHRGDLSPLRYGSLRSVSVDRHGDLSPLCSGCGLSLFPFERVTLIELVGG